MSDTKRSFNLSEPYLIQSLPDYYMLKYCDNPLHVFYEMSDDDSYAYDIDIKSFIRIVGTSINFQRLFWHVACYKFFLFIRC